ncbi:MAG: hypothetical protein NTZ74_03165 [Chloroflexi bacterium]|nr:hypothetical protein [Chloroflexota bacterium]
MFSIKPMGLCSYISLRTVLLKKVTSLKRKSTQLLDIKAEQIVERISPIAFIPSKGISNPQDVAERFSRLEKADRHHEVEEALQTVEPRLKRLSGNCKR